MSIDNDGELELLLGLVSPAISGQLHNHAQQSQLIEVVMDLGRRPLARFPGEEIELSTESVTFEDLEAAVAKVGHFDSDNRAGLDSTLHRISCIRNRQGRIIGLTCRVGRAVSGSAQLVADFVREGRSLLLLGRPGTGKTTAVREISRLLADECGKRVVIVDTSCEIGGDGDVPHPAIGTARRMQVPHPEQQHRVMIEAVENHTPQTIVIDEISTEAECLAARTIAQRGVQLIATAHGNKLENVINNPTLADLVGGIQSVTLGDEEAKKRGGQKSILERAAPPTFDVAIEILERSRWVVHADVAAATDALLAGQQEPGELREQDAEGNVQKLEFKGVVRAADSNGSHQNHEWWASRWGGGTVLLPTAATATASAAPVGRNEWRSAAAQHTSSPSHDVHATSMQGSTSYSSSSNIFDSPGAGATDSMPASTGSSGDAGCASSSSSSSKRDSTRLFLLMDDRSKEQLWRVLQADVDMALDLTDNLQASDLVVCTRSALRKQPRVRISANRAGVPVCTIKSIALSSLQRDLIPYMQRRFGTQQPATPQLGAWVSRSVSDDAETEDLETFEDEVDGTMFELAGIGSSSSSSSRLLESRDDDAASSSRRTSPAASSSGSFAADDVADLLLSLAEMSISRRRPEPTLDPDLAAANLRRFLQELPDCSAAGALKMLTALSATRHFKRFAAANRGELNQLACFVAQRAGVGGWPSTEVAAIVRLLVTWQDNLLLDADVAAWAEGLHRELLVAA